MIAFETVQEITANVLLFFAYIFSITISGNIQAFCAKKCGDSTAADHGFTEFNPFLFINFFDIMWFLIFRIMIGRPVPLELRHGIDRRHRWWRIRVFLIFASRTICNIIIAIFSTITQAVLLSINSSFDGSIISLLAAFCLALSMANIFLATFECCRQIIHFFILYKLEKDYRFIEYADYILVLGPLIIWLLFGQTIITTFSYGINCAVLGIAKACGA